MNGKMKMVAGIALVLAVLSIAFSATPALAEANGIQDGDQDRDQQRLRARDGSCDGAMLQEQLRLHGQDCNCTGEQYRERQRAENRISNEEPSLEQYRYQYRQGSI